MPHFPEEASFSAILRGVLKEVLASTVYAASVAMANGWRVYDMHGNVEEWTLDWKDYSLSLSVIDPMGALSGTLRILRGGSWIQDAYISASSCDSNWYPSSSDCYVGFRLFRTCP